VTNRIFDAKNDINGLLSHFSQSNRSTPKHIYLVFNQDINTIQERDNEIQDKRKRRDGEMPYLNFSPLLGGSPKATPNTISTSTATSTASSLPASTPNQQIEALWEKVAPSENWSSDDLNSEDLPTLGPGITVSPTSDLTPDPAPAPIPASIASKSTEFKYTSRSDDFTSSCSCSTHSTSTEVYTKEEAGSDYIKR
jgi:hypothetical protein